MRTLWPVEVSGPKSCCVPVMGSPRREARRSDSCPVCFLLNHVAIGWWKKDNKLGRRVLLEIREPSNREKFSFCN